MNIRELKAQKLEEQKQAHELKTSVANLLQGFEQMKAELEKVKARLSELEGESEEETTQVKPTKSTTPKK